MRFLPCLSEVPSIPRLVHSFLCNGTIAGLMVTSHGFMATNRSCVQLGGRRTLPAASASPTDVLPQRVALRIDAHFQNRSFRFPHVDAIDIDLHGQRRRAIESLSISLASGYMPSYRDGPSPASTLRSSPKRPSRTAPSSPLPARPSAPEAGGPAIAVRAAGGVVSLECDMK